MTDVAPGGAPRRAPSFLRELFTERDNSTADLKRVLWALGFVWALGMDTGLVLAGRANFDLVSAGLGIGGLLAAGAGALALNRKNENGASNP